MTIVQNVYEKMRPRDEYERILAMRIRDAGLFYDRFHTSFIDVPCPACNERGYSLFVKCGFNHKKCSNCSTLYCSPRPQEELLGHFYKEYESPKAWTDFLLKTDVERKVFQYEPRVKALIELLKSKGVKEGSSAAVDIGAGSGAFAVCLMRSAFFNNVLALDLSEKCVAACQRQGLNAQKGSIDSLKDGSVDFISMNDLLEHLFDPADFLRRCRRVLRPGGFLSVATPNGEGFDFQLLKEKTRNIMPPEHLSYFNPGSAAVLLKRVGFEIISVETPGRLDWSILENEIQKGFHLEEQNEYLSYLFSLKDESIGKDFQDFLVKHKLSSHMLIFAQRTETF